MREELSEIRQEIGIILEYLSEVLQHPPFDIPPTRSALSFIQRKLERTLVLVLKLEKEKRGIDDTTKPDNA